MRTILLTSALLSTLAFAQEQQPSPPVEVRAAEGAAKWIKQLGSDSYRDRLKAENELLELGEAARAPLEAAAADDRDSEVQWRAKRLLRQLGRATPAPKPRGGLVERSGPRGGARQAPEIVERGERRRGAGRDAGDMRAEFDRIFKRFEEMGLDVPSRRFFDQPFFKDLESQLDGGFGLGGGQAGQSTNVQIGPDGVRVEVTAPGEDGEPETKVYEAEDMESFRKKHPGVLKGDGLRMGFGGPGMDLDLDALRARVGELQRGFDWDLAEPRVLRLPQGGRLPQAGELELDDVQAAPMPQQGRRLGITTKPIPAAVRDYLQLGRTGLMVGDVQDDTLAAACGLQLDDIVVAIGGADIGSPSDVAAALGAVKKGEPVRVTFLRRGERKTAETAKRHDAAPGREELPPAERRGRAKIR